MHTPHQTAILLAVILNRSGQNRARLSGKTIKILGQRRNLRQAFSTQVIDALIEYGWALFETGGGYSAVRISTLDAAKPVTAKNGLSKQERDALREGNADWSSFEEEATGDLGRPDDEE